CERDMTLSNVVIAVGKLAYCSGETVSTVVVRQRIGVRVDETQCFNKFAFAVRSTKLSRAFNFFAPADHVPIRKRRRPKWMKIGHRDSPMRHRAFRVSAGYITESFFRGRVGKGMQKRHCPF